MAESLEIPVLERPSFFDGQRLTAADLAAVQGFHRELRWLHNRTAHRWGVVVGYAVEGAKGDRRVILGEGLALDCRGRELLLGEAVELPIPAVAGDAAGGAATYYLTASYSADADLEPELREGACESRGVVRRPERPLFRWESAGGVRAGLDVVLATVLIRNCALSKAPTTLSRRSAAPREEPDVGAGQTVAGETHWRRWPNERNAVGVATKVTTASAAFRTTPRYHARLGGERELGALAARAIVDGYADVAEPARTSFDFRVVLPTAFRTGRYRLNPPAVIQSQTFLDVLEATLKWHVVWMGVEG